MKAVAAVARRLPLWAIAGLALLVAWLFRDALLGGVYYKRDIHLVWHAQVEGFVRSVFAGAWPVWDPSLGFGRPLLADPSAQVLYPLTWLNLLLRPWRYYTAFVVLHAFLSSVGLFLLARRLDLPAPSAVVSAALWLLSGPYLSGVDLWHHFAGVSWLPWVVLAADRALEGRTIGRALLWGVVQGLQILAGSADACTMTALAVLALGVPRHVAWRRDAVRPNLELIGLGLLASLAAVGISCGLWLPALDQVSRAARADLPREIRTYWSVHPLGLLDTVFPGLWSNLPLNATMRALLFESREPFLGSLYLGVGALGLVLASVGGPGHPLRRPLGAILVLSLGVSLGSHAPFYGWATTLFPPFRILRYPVKVTVLGAFAWSLLGGIGCERWRRETSGGPPRWNRVALALALFSGLAAAGALMASWGAVFWASRLLALPASITAAQGLAPTASRLWVVAALGAGEALLAWWRGRTGAPRLSVMVSALALLDLGLYHRSPNPTAPASLYTYRPPVLASLADPETRVYVYDYGVPGKSVQYLGREGGYHVVRQPEGWTLDAASALAMQMYLAPESSGRWGLRGSYEIDYRGLYPRNLELLTRLLRSLEGTDLHLRFLRLAHVTHVVSLHRSGLEGLEPVTELPGLFREPILVFRVPDPLPRAYAVGRAQRVDGPDALAAMMAPGFDPRSEVVISGGDAMPPTASFVGTSRVLASGPDRVTLEAELSAPGYVVLLDGYDPGWQRRGRWEAGARPLRQRRLSRRRSGAPDAT